MSERIFRRTLLIGSASAALAPVLAPGVAGAQQVTAIEEVVVTAQRRTQNLQDAPVAVTALSTQALEQGNVRTTGDLMRLTPGLQVSTQSPGDNGGSATFFLRGMGQQRAGNGSEPAVGIYVDDLYYPTLQGSVFSIVDLEQVEVLRGPQGTLFGRNTIGGAIRYTTRRPQNDFSGNVTATYGSYERQDLTGALNVPLGDKAAVRLTAGRLYTDGYVRQQNGGRDAGRNISELFRAAVRLRPVDTVTVDLSYQNSRSGLDGFPVYQPGPILANPPLASGQYNNIAPSRGLPLYNNQFASQCHYCQAGTNVRESSKARIQSGSAEVTWEVWEGLRVKSLTGWQSVKAATATDLDGSPALVFNTSSANTTEALSQEVQVNFEGLDGRFNAVGGLFFYREDNTLAQDPAAPSTRIGNVLPQGTDNNRETHSAAAFFDGSFDVTDRLTVLGGVRRSVDNKDVRATNPNTGVLIDARSDTYKSTTGRLGVRYRWSNDVMTYATVSTGFRGGGFNFTTNRYFTFDPEKATSYEVGARMEFWDRRVRINPTAFYTKWKNIQVQSIVPIPTGSAIVLDNAAAATSYGLEVEGVVQVTRDFRISGNLATLDIGYDDIGTANGITLDSKLQRAPKLTAGLSADYRHELANAWTLAASANYSYQGAQYSTATDADQLRLKAYSLVGARISLTDPSDRWTLSAYGTNLTNTFYFVGGINFFPTGVGTQHYDLGRPREVGVAVRYAF